MKFFLNETKLEMKRSWKWNEVENETKKLKIKQRIWKCNNKVENETTKLKMNILVNFYFLLLDMKIFDKLDHPSKII